MINSAEPRIVYIGDPKDSDEMLAWAKRNCPSYITSRGQDVSDASYVYDEIYVFYFSDERDALMFQMKWG
jgi:hypothetical protein